jgi:hypothetical protein
MPPTRGKESEMIFADPPSRFPPDDCDPFARPRYVVRPAVTLHGDDRWHVIKPKTNEYGYDVAEYVAECRSEAAARLVMTALNGYMRRLEDADRAESY